MPSSLQDILLKFDNPGKVFLYGDMACFLWTRQRNPFDKRYEPTLLLAIQWDQDVMFRKELDHQIQNHSWKSVDLSKTRWQLEDEAQNALLKIGKRGKAVETLAHVEIFPFFEGDFEQRYVGVYGVGYSFFSQYRDIGVQVMIGITAWTLLGMALVWFGLMKKREKEFYDEKSTFLTGLSHELKTPLQVMRGIGDNMQHLEPTRDRSTIYGKLVCEETARLQNLVEYMLDFSRFTEMNLDENSLEGVAMKEMWGSVCHARGILLDKAELKIISDIPDMFIVKGTPLLWEKILGTILDNALTYAKNGKKVLFEAVVKDKKGFILIKDFGPGLIKGEEEKIFQRFIRGSAAEHTQKRGWGMGLYFARQVLKSWGGQIKAYNRKDNQDGMTMEIRIPLVKEVI